MDELEVCPMEGRACQVIRVQERRCEAEVGQVRSDTGLVWSTSDIFGADVLGSRDQGRSETRRSHREVLPS